MCITLTVLYLNIVIVRYIPAESGKYSLPVTRDTIWHDTKGKRLKDIGVYQPEQDGYQVASISIGIV